MSETNAQEPTMEEILASIRRIISEDDAPPASPDETPYAATESATPPPPPASEPSGRSVFEPAVAEEDDVLELTQPLQPPAHEPPTLEPQTLEPPTREPQAMAPSPPKLAPMPPVSARETLGDLDLSPAKPPPAPAVAAAPPPRPDAGLISGQAASAAASSFSQLTRSIAMPAEGKTLEDVVTALLRPMLKDWLDQNLPAIVERKVQAEVERISRSQGG